MTDYNTTDPRNVDNVEDMIIALRENDNNYRTDFGDNRTAAIDIQFKADSSFGLSKKRYGWHSNTNLFDSTHFSEVDGLIGIETSAIGTDTAQPERLVEQKK